MTVAEHAAKDAATLARIEAAFAGLTADIVWMKAEIVRLGGVIPPPTDDAAILAELTDSSLAGMDKRLGPKALAGNTPPDVWTRAEVPTEDMGFEDGATDLGTYSQGLSVTAPATIPPAPKPKFDFGGTEIEIAAVDDAGLVVNPGNLAAINSDGIPDSAPGPQGVGVYRQRTEEHKGGMVRLMPRTGPDATGSDFPDRRAVMGHTASYGMGNKLGRPIQVVRGRINRYDGGFVLYDQSRGGAAYIGTIPTQTAWSPWSGEMLSDNLIPLCLGISSQNEFLFVCVHDKTTGTGKLVVIVNWANSAGIQSFPFDFNVPMPGLVQSGVVTGMKILGTVDLPVKWPTSISIATSRNTGGNRIEGPDGNAAYLSGWDLSTKANRDSFMVKNGGWIATWGKIVVGAKYENKVVQLDATALFQGYRDQYFTTQANYDASRPQHPDLAWWQVYETGNQSVWPYMLPAWVPTVTRVLSVTRPTAVLMLETNDGAFVVGSESGALGWFKDDGTPDGQLMMAGGGNITSLNDDKYQGAFRSGALIAVSRVARSVYGIHNKQLSWTIQDSKLLDPVDAEVGDTHGIETRFVTVADFSGKKVIQYRNSVLTLATQGGIVFGSGTTGDAAAEDLECLGKKDLPGHPVSLRGSNVN